MQSFLMDRNEREGRRTEREGGRKGKKRTSRRERGQGEHIMNAGIIAVVT